MGFLLILLEDPTTEQFICSRTEVRDRLGSTQYRVPSIVVSCADQLFHVVFTHSWMVDTVLKGEIVILNDVVDISLVVSFRLIEREHLCERVIVVSQIVVKNRC